MRTLIKLLIARGKVTFFFMKLYIGKKFSRVIVARLLLALLPSKKTRPLANKKIKEMVLSAAKARRNCSFDRKVSEHIILFLFFF